MEKINAISEINDLKSNKVIISKDVSMDNTTITFQGQNNILFMEDGVTIANSQITFDGSDSVIYLSSSKNVYYIDCYIANGSVIYFGQKLSISSYLSTRLVAFATEGQNIILGDDCMLSFGIFMRTSDAHCIYDCKSRKRINHSKSILIGDHVWLGQNALILKGAKIGSGSIIGANSVLSSKTIPSNTMAAGNGIKILRENVFFTRRTVHGYREEDTLDSETFKNEELIYTYSKSKENKSMSEIDNFLKKATSAEKKMSIIISCLVESKEKNRFYME